MFSPQAKSQFLPKNLTCFLDGFVVIGKHTVATFTWSANLKFFQSPDTRPSSWQEFRSRFIDEYIKISVVFV